MFVDKLKASYACDEAIAWVGNKTAQEAWDSCENSTWLFWLLMVTKTDPVPLTNELMVHAEPDTLNMARLEVALENALKNIDQSWSMLYRIHCSVDTIRRIYPNVPELPDVC